MLLSGTAYALGDLASFAPAALGYHPQSTLVRDAAGNFYGTTANGGGHDDGTVFLIAAGTNSVTTLASFHGPDGAGPAAGVTLGPSGDLFGTTQQGGASGVGTVFELAKGSASVTTLASFGTAGGGFNPLGAVAVDAAGNVFGTTNTGGDFAAGTLFEVAKGTNALTTLASFDGSDGYGPQGALAIDPAGNLFGAASGGGDNGSGTVFKLPRGSSALTALASFNGANGSNPLGGVTLDSSGNLFGTASFGGANGNGTVFELPKGSSALTALASFNGSNGSKPVAAVALDSSGNLYGTASNGGASGDGTVFKVAKNSGAVTALASFDAGSSGSEPDGGVALDSSGNLYGTANNDGPGPSAFGTVYRLPAGGSAITPLVTLRGADGGYPSAGVGFDHSGNLYGTTAIGGPSDDGRVFVVAKGTNSVTTVAAFNGSNGSAPLGGVVADAAGNLFGATSAGGPTGDGVVYEVAKGSSSVTALASFNDANGSNPSGTLALDSSGNLFGTTGGGGANEAGTVFELAAATHAITTLASFAVSDGAGPTGVVALDSSGNLYGTAEFGGDANSDGTVWEVAKGSRALTALASFSGANGSNPVGGVTLDSSGNLYGTARQGGDTSGNPNGQGTVWEVAKGSRAITALARFHGPDGSDPQGAVAVDSGGNVFGTTRQGGDTAGDGVAFEVAKGSGAAEALALFDGVSGALSTGAVAMDSGGTLYGTTQIGGTANTGAVFQLYQPASLAFLQPPTSGTPGVPLSPAVKVVVKDAAGNAVATDNSAVTLTLSGGTFAGGSATATAPTTGGVATFNNLVINSPGNYSLTASLASLSTAVPLTISAPTIQAVAISDGSTNTNQAQRSEVRELVVTFAQPTVLLPGLLGLNLQNSGGSGTSAGGGPTGAPTALTGALGIPTPVVGSSGTQWLVPVLANTPYTDATGSLNDGVYTLTLGGVPTTVTFHRLFGDVDGNKTINALDYGKFKLAFGTSAGASAYNADLDFDNNGTINAGDYGQFRKRFGLTLTAGLPPPAVVGGVAVSDSASGGAVQAQRSEVRSLTVTFSEPVNLGVNAFSLQRLNSGGSGSNDGSAPTDATGALGAPAMVAGSGGTQWVVPILAGTAFSDPTGSLGDGIYQLTAVASNVVANGTPMAADAVLAFHRLFGDIDGNKSVSALDYARFKQAFGSSTGSAAYNPDVDFDNNGSVNALDFAQFRKRFGLTFTY